MKLSLQNGWIMHAYGMWKPEHITIAMLEKMLWEPWQNYLKSFEIILHSQSFIQTVLCFLFRSIFGIIATVVAVAASSSLIVLSWNRWKSLKKQVCMIICLSHRIVSFKLNRLELLRFQNQIRVIQFISYKSFCVRPR